MTDPLAFCKECGYALPVQFRHNPNDVLDQIDQARVDDDQVLLLSTLYRCQDEITKLRAEVAILAKVQMADDQLDELLNKLKDASRIMQSPAMGLLLLEAASWIKSLRKMLEIKGVII